MYKSDPPVFNKHTIKCEKDGCPLAAEYKITTVLRKKHYCCEQHWRELVNQVQVVTWQRI